MGEPDEEIGKVLKELDRYCKEKRGRGRRVAEKLGISEQLLSNWLHGHKVPTLKGWLRIKELLKKARRKR
jgi:transcriptional regulator with XRE-family HTH domain